MKKKKKSSATLVYLPLVLLSILAHLSVEVSYNGGEEGLKRSDFPPGFLFGVSTSSYQIEGAYLEDGKSLSNWDVFCLSSAGTPNNCENGNVAVDHYHLYTKDIELMHSLGIDAYRFSISWARVLPRGRFGEVNPSGIEFYNKIIDNLLLKGIEPIVTIHHHDFPQELEERYNSWLSPLMQDDFVHFAKTCFESFGDRVKYWLTINEPNLFSELAYERGIYPPARCSQPLGNCSVGNSDVEPLIAMHNMLLAHGKAAKIYHEHFQHQYSGFIGIVGNAINIEPMRDNELDQEAATRALAFSVAWTLDPIVFGDYPPEMRRYHGSELPEFSLEETMYMRDSADFIAINHYTTIYAKDCTNINCPSGGDRAIEGYVYSTGERDGVSIGERTGVPRLYVVPRGMEEIINYVKNRYNNKPIFITENGYSSPDKEEKVQDVLNDVKRIEYHEAYLSYLARAIRGGADVRGYFVWTLMDDYEWGIGYSTRFGLHYVDPLTMDRIPKLSAKWYRDFLKNTTTIHSNEASTSSLKENANSEVVLGIKVEI